MPTLQETFGNIDIYLFDQIQKGRFGAGLAMGCGGGAEFGVFPPSRFAGVGIDPQPEAIAVVQELCRTLAPANPEDNFRVGNIEESPFAGQQFDLVICNAVLHFARDQAHFDQMLKRFGRQSDRADSFSFAWLPTSALKAKFSRLATAASCFRTAPNAF